LRALNPRIEFEVEALNPRIGCEVEGGGFLEHAAIPVVGAVEGAILAAVRHRVRVHHSEPRYAPEKKWLLWNEYGTDKTAKTRF